MQPLTWDIWIRLFHWSLALAVGFQLLSGLTGFEFYQWHGLVGEIVLALVVFRLLWGVVGSENAGLAGLVTGPRAVWRHFVHLLHRDVPSERGHNAAGGWAVLAMLALVGTQAITGLYIADEDEFMEGALYGTTSGATADLLYRVHRINADLLQAIVALHIAMIALYWIWGRRNLLTPMLTGRTSHATNDPAADDNTSCDVATPSPMLVLGKGLFCALAAAGATGLIVGWW